MELFMLALPMPGLCMPPPLVELLLVMVTLLSVIGFQLLIPPPAAAVFDDIVAFVSVAVPMLNSPPPDETWLALLDIVLLVKVRIAPCASGMLLEMPPPDPAAMLLEKLL